jgi:membrane-associated phospholipid phosphatase
MPRLRRIGNRAASLLLLGAARTWIPDTQNGMRLFRTDTLHALPLPDGGFEAESRHLRSLVGADRRVASVEIPTIYEGEPSHFRPIADTAAVARALFGSPPTRDRADPASQPLALPGLRGWGPRLAASMGAALAIAAALPALQPLDNQLFLAINGLGDGPEWLYAALDPHTRNYVALIVVTLVAAAACVRRPRRVIGAGLAMLLAGYLAGGALEVLKLFVERPRPEEVLATDVLLSHGRTWAHLASFPSGHLMVTAAMAAAAAAAVPILRRPLIFYVALVGFTRVLFGAHFPLDVLVGAALGHELGLFSVSVLANARLLPGRRGADMTDRLSRPLAALETKQ